ncbi:hypothetical protein D3C75_1254600 [compost metagenome]
MEQTIAYYEAGMELPWDGQIPDHVYGRLIQGVVGFKIRISRMEGQWKLHQDHSTQRRSRLIGHLRQTGDRDAIRIADAIAAANAEPGE